jgi:hypothetical protein
VKPNVRIVLRERGKISQVRDVHNIWTAYGRSWLAGLVSLGPLDVPERDDRIKYIGFGIGGKGQSQLGMVNSPNWSTVLPAGSDPHTTTGNEYDDEFPIAPLIGTLERPAPIVAQTTTPAYALAVDWRTHQFDPLLFQQPLSHPDPYTTRYFAQFRQGIGGVYYFIHEPLVVGGLAQMPISEAGLFLNSATTTAAFEPVVTYVTFDTVQITKDTDLEVEWDVRF